MSEPTLEEVAARLDHATSDLDSLDKTARAVVDELLDAMGVLHKSALTTMVRRLRDDPRGRELLYELVDDPGVRMVLSVHGIIRLPSGEGGGGASAGGSVSAGHSGRTGNGGHAGCGCGAGGDGSATGSAGAGHSGHGAPSPQGARGGCGCGSGGGCGSGSGTGAQAAKTFIPVGSLGRAPGGRG